MNLNLVREWVKVYHRRIILAGVGLVLVGAGVFWLKSEDDATGVKILSTQDEVVSGMADEEIVVDVSGAVVRPGVYRFKNGNRIGDALVTAGGLAEEADTKWVEMNLNRSAKLADGMKIYIPRSGGENTQSTSNNDQEKVNINTGSASELDVLPGVGPATAAKIISGRPYTQADELLQKKIVSQKVWDQIKEQVTVW